MDSDGTLLLRFAAPCPGSELTARAAERLGRPLLCVDAASTPPTAAARAATRFIERYGIRALNVAGPRASVEPAGQDYAREVLREVIRRILRAEHTGRQRLGAAPGGRTER